MRKCHCGFNRLVEGGEGGEGTVEVDLRNLNLKYGVKKVFYYSFNNKKWYLYTGTYNQFKNAKNAATNIEKIERISEVSNVNYKETLTELENIGVDLISYSNYTEHCNGIFNRDKCARGRVNIFLPSTLRKKYTINYSDSIHQPNSKTYCRDLGNSMQEISGDIRQITSFKSEFSVNCGK